MCCTRLLASPVSVAGPGRAAQGRGELTTQPRPAPVGALCENGRDLESGGAELGALSLPVGNPSWLQVAGVR